MGTIDEMALLKKKTTQNIKRKPTQTNQVSRVNSIYNKFGKQRGKLDETTGRQRDKSGCGIFYRNGPCFCKKLMAWERPREEMSLELRDLRKMTIYNVYICAVQYRSHQPHVATEMCWKT